MLTQERLKEVLSYDESTGVFVRIASGKIAGSYMTGGYRRVRVDGKVYLCHRLAWLYVNGKFPKDGIDHINGVKDDNRISNLREADYSQNGQNQDLRRLSKSGYAGVIYLKRICKWKARIKVMGKEIHLGVFDSPEDAHAAYLKAKKEKHPYFHKFPD